MIPNIFVSSTIEELHHLRDTIRDTIKELGYNPIMSEYGDIGYLPSHSVVDSCYIALEDCQFAIIIIGKRYGSISVTGLSITHTEYEILKDRNIPIIFLVDKEVVSFKDVFENNIKNEEITFPGMDYPTLTFRLLNEFISSPVNNGFLAFGSVSEARSNIKKQLALIYGDLLRQKTDPIKTNMHDILSEIRTLRYELLKGKRDYIPFLKATRFLLNDDQKNYKELLENIYSNIDDAIVSIVTCSSFKEAIEKAGGSIEPKEVFESLTESREKTKKANGPKKVIHHQIAQGSRYQLLPILDEEYDRLEWQILLDKTILLNKKAYEYFDRVHKQLLQNIGN